MSNKGSDLDKKTNEAHPIYAFRTYSPKHKEELVKRIKKVVSLLNAKSAGREPKKTVHQVVIDAIELGLKILESEAKKK